MQINGQTNKAMFTAMKKQYEAFKQTKAAPFLLLPNTIHIGFSDLMILKKLPLYKNNKHFVDMKAIVGGADGFETIRIINTEMVKFFKQSL